MNIKGFTLIELLTVTCIALIVTLVAIPGLSDLATRQSLKTASYSLMRELAFARETAITSRTHVTICPTQDLIECSKAWESTFLVFLDPNSNGQLDSNETPLRQITIDSRWRVDWSAFGGKSNITYTEQGYTKHQNGSFSICPTSQGLQLGRLIVINKPGRARISDDKNHNGLSEKSDGKDMNCEI